MITQGTRDNSIQISNRNCFLDILKTVATVLIVFHHFQQGFNVRFSLINFYGDTFYFGRVVELFFMISGMLMVSYIPKIENGLSLKKFFTKRYMRLIPIVAFSTVFQLIIYILLNRTTVEESVRVLCETVSVALGFHGIICSDVTVVNNPMWYVSILIWCYFVFYFSFYIVKKFPIRILKIILPLVFILIGMIFIVSKCDYPFANVYIGRGFASFFGGVFLGKILSNKLLSGKWLLPLCLSVFVVSIIPTLLFQGLSNRDETILYMMCFCFSPLLVVSQLNPIKKLFKNNVWGTIANVSFHAYCFHTPIKSVLLGIPNLEYLIISNGLVSMFLYTIIVYLVGYCSYIFLEKPLFRLFKKIGI